MARNKVEKIAFNLKVEATRDGSPYQLKSKKRNSGNTIRLSLDLNPNNEVGDTDDLHLKPEQIQEVFDFITKKLFPSIQKISREKKKDFNKINRIIFKQNSPGVAEVSYTERYNGDLQPPPYWP